MCNIATKDVYSYLLASKRASGVKSQSSCVVNTISTDLTMEEWCNKFSSSWGWNDDTEEPYLKGFYWEDNAVAPR